jgi:phosphate transport system substrate-binding protein
MPQKIFTRYAILAFILAAALPFAVGSLYAAISSISRIVVDLLGGGIRGGSLAEIGVVLLCVAFIILAGWLWAAKAPLPDTLFARFMPLLAPPLLLPLAYILQTLFVEPMALGLILGILLLMAGGLYGCFYLVFLIRSELRRRSTAKMRGAAYLLCIILACAVGSVAANRISMRDLVEWRQGEASVGHGVNIWNYWPFSENKYDKLVRPAFTPSLRIETDHPRLDGAIAAFPVYAAFTQAVYAGLDARAARKIVDCTNTVEAYKRLVDGKVDIFFGAAPSQAQRDYAASKGLALTETPIGKEAFVFLGHKDNPVRSLTQAQVRAVYSGRVRNWKELGGPDEAILAFQRPENSGSQTAMLRLMNGEAMSRPLYEEQSEGMGDVVIGVAAYRNRNNALGYSFRWYATVLFSSPDIRLLAIDGVDPTPENIRNNTYPFTMPLLAVTARPLSAESKNLLDWITGPEGQELLERVGYVPLH